MSILEDRRRPSRQMFTVSLLYTFLVLLLWNFDFFDDQPYRVVTAFVFWAGIIFVQMKLERANYNRSVRELNKRHSKKQSALGGSSEKIKESVYRVVPLSTHMLKITLAFIVAILLEHLISDFNIRGIVFWILVASLLGVFYYIIYQFIVFLWHSGWNAILILSDDGLIWSGNYPFLISWSELGFVVIEYRHISPILSRFPNYVKGLTITIPDNEGRRPKIGTGVLYFERDGVEKVFIQGPFIDASYEDILHDIERRFGKKFSGVELPWD